MALPTITCMQRIAAATGNELMVEQTSNLPTRLLRYYYLVIIMSSDEELVDEHHGIVRAIQARKPNQARGRCNRTCHPHNLTRKFDQNSHGKIGCGGAQVSGTPAPSRTTRPLESVNFFFLISCNSGKCPRKSSFDRDSFLRIAIDGGEPSPTVSIWTETTYASSNSFPHHLIPERLCSMRLFRSREQARFLRFAMARPSGPTPF